MAIYSDARLNYILEKGNFDKKHNENIDRNIENIKAARDMGLAYANNNINDMKSRISPKKKKKPVKETFLFDKNGNLVNGDEESIEENIKNNTEIEIKKAKMRKDKQDEYDAEHPVEYIAKKTGSGVGALTGGAVGGVAGAVSGAAIGGSLGGIVGGVAGASSGGKAMNNVISKGFKNTRETIDKVLHRKPKKEDFDWRNVYRTEEFSRAMNEYFDITHNETRKVLLAVNEEDQNKVLISLTSKLYDSLMDKIDDIDFGDIPLTKGDITKLSNYGKICECLGTMNSLLIEFRQSTEPVDVIKTAIANIIDSVNIWKRAFTGNVELPMVVYNTVVLSIIEATSYMLAMCIEYIKSPSDDSFQISIDKSALNKTKSHMLFDNLKKFNDAYKKGQVENAMNYVIKENVKNFGGTMTIGVGAAVAGITGLLFCIVPIIRELIFLFYYTRVRTSEFFDIQSDLLQMSAHNVEVNRTDLTKEERKNISSKQMKVAERFRTIANKISFTMKNSEVTASKEMVRSNKKYKVDEVMDELPDSASSALF